MKYLRYGKYEISMARWKTWETDRTVTILAAIFMFWLILSLPIVLLIP